MPPHKSASSPSSTPTSPAPLSDASRRVSTRIAKRTAAVARAAASRAAAVAAAATPSTAPPSSPSHSASASMSYPRSPSPGPSNPPPAQGLLQAAATASGAAASFGFRDELDVLGKELEGREILICWEDGCWYDAIVVRYYPKKDEYKLVYRADDGVEVASLAERRWAVAPKKSRLHNEVILDGAIVEFEYPADQKRYKAMIYDYSHEGDRIKVAYLGEHSTDTLKGGGWDVLSPSPCILDENAADDASSEKYLESGMRLIRQAFDMLSKHAASSASKSRREPDE